MLRIHFSHRSNWCKDPLDKESLEEWYKRQPYKTIKDWLAQSCDVAM